MKILLTLPLLLAACVTTFSSGKDVALEDAEWIQVGETTRADVVVRLGAPTWTSVQGSGFGFPGESDLRASVPPGQELLVWAHATGRTTAAGLLFIHSVAHDVTSERVSVFVSTETGVVTAWRFEGEVNGAWQSVSPTEPPLTAEEVQALRVEAASGQ